MTLDSSGNLYGTTQFAYDYYGSVYELSPSGSGWVEQTIHKFQLDDGGFPYASVILDNVGNLYGATTAYGVNNGGTAFELSPSNGSWSFSLLYSFVAACCGETGREPIWCSTEPEIYMAPLPLTAPISLVLSSNSRAAATVGLTRRFTISTTRASPLFR